jgi:hypothetical protein
MKQFSALILLRVPPAALFTAMRDRLGEIAPALADIRSIEELERVRGQEGVLVTNRWRARQQVPSFLQSRLGGSEISWIDRASWSEGTFSANWSIEPSVGNGAISCNGSTRFEPAMAARGTRAVFEGILTIQPSFIASIVGPFEAPVTALVESIATTMIPTNFRAAVEAAAKLR